MIRHRFLDPRASAAVVAQKMRQCDYSISTSTVQRIIGAYGLEKKLYINVSNEKVLEVETHSTKRKTRCEPSDSRSIERRVRQQLADGVCGNHLGLWLLADREHFTVELVENIYRDSAFDLVVPMPGQPYIQKLLKAIPPEQFTRRWAGMATAQVPYAFGNSDAGPFHLFAQRSRETPQEHGYKGFLCTDDRDEVETLSVDFPKRWHIEEFFNANQDLGWRRAVTQNMHIRYGQMTMALLAQASICQLRQRLVDPADQWNAKHLAKEIFCGLDGGLRVHGDTVVITYYNAPNAAMLREHFEGLPERLEAEGIPPGIPWLYNLKLDFRFK